MKMLFALVCLLALLGAGCNKDQTKERTGIDDHPKGTTNLSGLDATGPAGAGRTNK